MAVITYDQVWAIDLWLEQPVTVRANNEIAARFLLIPQIAELIEMGYTPTISKYHDMNTQNITFTYRFDIPEEVRTFMVLKYPDLVAEIDFDAMVTIKEK